MAFTVPKAKDLEKEALDTYQGLLPSKNVSRGSEPWVWAKVIAKVAWGILARLIDFDRQRLPDTATATNLQRWGSVYKFTKLGPTSSQGALALRVSGAATTAVPQDSELAHSDGTLYKVTTAGAVVGGGGTVDVDVAAKSTGLATNKRTGETLTFTNPPAGITPAASLVKDLDGGTDNEGDEQYRPRLNDRIGDPPQGGAIADYSLNARSVPTLSIATAYVYQHRRGLGTIDVAVLKSGSASARLVTDLTSVMNFVDSKRPAGMKDFKVLTVVVVTQDVTVDIEIDATTYKWDWDDLGVGYTITAINAGTKTLTVPTAPTAAKVVGKRITVRGEEAKIVGVAGNDLTLDVWFSFAPTAGVDVIRASGDLVVPARNAIIGQIDVLGPARGNYGASVWEDTLRTAKLLGSIVPTKPNTGITGIKDAVLITPLANVVPTDPVATNDAQINLLVPGNIAVRKKP